MGGGGEVVGGVEPGGADAEDGLTGLVEAEGTQSGGGFVGTGGAGASGGGADALLVEPDEEGFGFDAVDGEEGGVGEAGLVVAYDVDSIEVLEEGLFEGVAGEGEGGHGGEAVGDGAFGGEAEAGDAGDVFGAGAEGEFLITAGIGGGEVAGGAEVEGACAFGSMEFMGTKGDEVGSEGLGLEGDFAEGLDGVAMDEGSGAVGDCGDFGEGVEDAGFVVGEHGADEGGTGGAEGLELVEVEAAIGEEGEIDGLVAAGLEDGFEPGDGWMFEGGKKDGVAGAWGGMGGEGAEDGEVVAFGAAAGEDDGGGRGGDGGGDLGAGAVDGKGGGAGEGVGGGGIGKLGGEVGLHDLNDRVINLGGCVVVEIDHGARKGFLRKCPGKSTLLHGKAFNLMGYHER